jgi:hypothetical protein
MPTYKTLICDQCLEYFNRAQTCISSMNNKEQTAKFCSKKCYAKSLQIKILVQCAHCQTPITKSPSAIKHARNVFCSKSCSAIYNNTHKTKGTCRSRLEIFLEEQIRVSYPDLVLLCNDKSAIDSELDFYFPDLHLAIELNGIFHFEPIFGKKKLDQTQNNDKKKIFACNQKEINLAIIDTSASTHFNQKAKNKYWKIVNNIIQESI